MDDGKKPLFAGLKVVECATYIAAPTAATVLADFGADVIKVEQPGEGDPWRTAYARIVTPPPAYNFPYLVDNRNKRAIVADLKSEAGRAVLERLVADADVFITNLPLPVRARLRVQYSDFAEKYPRLIYGSFTAYGEEGEEAGKTGFDLTAFWARSGLMDQVRSDRAVVPAGSVAGMGDHPSGMAFYGGIVTALFRRERTGEGGEVRASLLGSGMWANSFSIQAALCGAELPVRARRTEVPRALSNIYRSSDERWFLLALTSEAKQWPALVRAIGREDLLDDPRFADVEHRQQNSSALVAIFDEVFARGTLAEWRVVLDRAGLTFGIVSTYQEAARDEQAIAAGILRPIAGTDMLTVDSPFTVTGADKVPVLAHAERGADTEAVLREHGFSDDEIGTLLATGAVANG